MTRLLVLFSLAATYLVFGGNSIVYASDTRAMQLTYEPWTKMCIGNSSCFVGAGTRGTCYPSGGGVSIAELNGKSRSLFAYFSTKQMLEGGISVLIDQEQLILIPQPECRGLGCSGKFEVDSEFIKRMKRAQTVTIEATTTAHQKLRLSFSLAGFTQAYEGPGYEPEVREEILTSEQMKELMERTEKERPPQCEE